MWMIKTRIALVCVIALLLSMTVALAATPYKTIAIQGVLKKTGGAPVSDGTYQVTFRIYNDSTLGSTTACVNSQYCLYEKIIASVKTSGGIFNVSLDNINLPFDKQYYLGITVSGNTEMKPRSNLTYSAYSFVANSLMPGTPLRYNSSDKSYIIGSGFVGIGTTDPKYKLDVMGQISSSYGFCMGTDCRMDWPAVTNMVKDPYFNVRNEDNSKLSEWLVYSPNPGTVNFTNSTIEILPDYKRVQALELTTNGEIQANSTFMPVENWKSYKVSVWVKSNSTCVVGSPGCGNLSFGIYCYNVNKQPSNCWDKDGSGGSWPTWRGQLPATNIWFKKTGYMYGSNSRLSSIPNDTSGSNVYFFGTDTVYIQIWFRNLPNSQITGNWFSLPTIEEMTAADDTWAVKDNATISMMPGNVGIGTTTPTSKLDVVGDIAVGGFLKIGVIDITPTADCSTPAHYGRMKFYQSGGAYKLYVCTSGGWKTATVT